MRKITLSEYNSIPKDYRGIWTVERWDLPNWAEIREKHMGKRTMMVYDKGTCLLVEGKYPLIPTLWMIFEDSTFAFRSGDKHRSRRIYGK